MNSILHYTHALFLNSSCVVVFFLQVHHVLGHLGPNDIWMVMVVAGFVFFFIPQVHHVLPPLGPNARRVCRRPADASASDRPGRPRQGHLRQRQVRADVPTCRRSRTRLIRSLWRHSRSSVGDERGMMRRVKAIVKKKHTNIEGGLKKKSAAADVQRTAPNSP